LLDAVVERQAKLISQWQLVGFIHGVMNTDNMALSGETIDYGPCAFMDSYHPATVFSSIDRNGRYAYGQQPHIAQWNLARLAEALLPSLPAMMKRRRLRSLTKARRPKRFEERFKHHSARRHEGEAGPLPPRKTTTRCWWKALLDWMQQAKADSTNTSRRP